MDDKQARLGTFYTIARTMDLLLFGFRSGGRYQQIFNLKFETCTRKVYYNIFFPQPIQVSQNSNTNTSIK